MLLIISYLVKYPNMFDKLVNLVFQKYISVYNKHEY